MNERIRELCSQAISDVDGIQNPDTQHMYIPDCFAEKFAQLIVQECIDIISPYSVRMIRPGEAYLHPIQEIKKHLGVEE